MTSASGERRTAAHSVTHQCIRLVEIILPHGAPPFGLATEVEHGQPHIIPMHAVYVEHVCRAGRVLAES